MTVAVKYYIFTRGIFLLFLCGLLLWEAIAWWQEIKKRAKEETRPLFPQSTAQSSDIHGVLGFFVLLVPVLGEVIVLLLAGSALAEVLKTYAERAIRKLYGPKKEGTKT